MHSLRKLASVCLIVVLTGVSAFLPASAEPGVSQLSWVLADYLSLSSDGCVETRIYVSAGTIHGVDASRSVQVDNLSIRDLCEEEGLVSVFAISADFNLFVHPGGNWASLTATVPNQYCTGTQCSSLASDVLSVDLTFTGTGVEVDGAYEAVVTGSVSDGVTNFTPGPFERGAIFRGIVPN